MITLHQPPPGWGLPCISPFCVKVETYLRMAKIDYRTAAPNILKTAPNGRIPYVTMDSRIIGDSSLIIRELKSHFGDPLDGALTPEQNAMALALQRVTEDHLYFAAAWLRWSDPESWGYVRDYFMALLPPVIGGFIVKKIRKDLLKILRTQGTGEHSRDEIVAWAKADLTAISVLLGRKPFFLGDEPSGIDATMYGFLIQQLWIPWESPVKQHALELGNLDAFCQRMKQRFWS